MDLSLLLMTSKGNGIYTIQIALFYRIRTDSCMYFSVQVLFFFPWFD